MTDQRILDASFKEEVIKHMATQSAYGKIQAEKTAKLEKTIELAFRGIDLQKMQTKVETHGRHIAIIYGIGITVVAVWQAMTRKLFGG